MALPETTDTWAPCFDGPPEATIVGSAEVSAALWARGRDEYEFTKPADAELNTVSVLVEGSGIQRCYMDGRPVYDKRRIAGQACISVAGHGARDYELNFPGPCRVLHLYLPQRVIDQIVYTESFAPRVAAVELIDPQCISDEHIFILGREVFTEIREQAHFSRLRLDTLAQDLAIHLLRTYSNLASSKRIVRPHSLGGLSSSQLKAVYERLMACIEPNGKDPSLHDLAATVGLSPTHFCRAFARSVGVPPYRWLTERRIERSKFLMRTGQFLGLAEVARAVGYANQTSFGRAFRRITGVAPREWRRDAVTWRGFDSDDLVEA